MFGGAGGANGVSPYLNKIEIEITENGDMNL